jgi:hypothetical protein
MPDHTDDTDGLTNDSLSVLLASGEPVTFTATVSQNSPPASPEPVTYAGWGPWEDNPSLSEDLGIAWVSGDGGTRDHGNNDVVLKNIMISSFSGGDSSSETEPRTAIAMAESGGNTEAHAPHGEDSLGLWQINIDPAQTDNPDTFDCSEIVQWASGPAVQTGAWIADVTFERDASQPESANNLKQIVLALHALDAGYCSVDICAQNSPSASPAPDNSRGYTAGHFALELEGHNASPTVDYGTGSFIIQNVSDPATIDASLVFDSTGGDRSTVLLPYLEQRGGEADDGGFVIDWTTGDGPKGGDTVGVIAIITPTEHGSSILEFSVENFPAFPQPENNAVATESLEIAHEGFLGDSKGVINWFSGDGGTISDPGTFPTETTRPMGSDGQDDGWCMGTEIDFPESVHALYDLIV